MCGFYWGSHGCDYPDKNHTIHQCGLAKTGDGLCSQYDETTSRVRFNQENTGAGPAVWGEWLDSAPGFYYS